MSQNDKCVHCSTGQSIVESRRDAFATANDLLKNAGLPKPTDGEVVAYSVADVMNLANYLLGMDD